MDSELLIKKVSAFNNIRREADSPYRLGVYVNQTTARACDASNYIEVELLETITEYTGYVNASGCPIGFAIETADITVNAKQPPYPKFNKLVELSGDLISFMLRDLFEAAVLAGQFQTPEFAEYAVFNLGNGVIRLNAIRAFIEVCQVFEPITSFDDVLIEEYLTPFGGYALRLSAMFADGSVMAAISGSSIDCEFPYLYTLTELQDKLKEEQELLTLM